MKVPTGKRNAYLKSAKGVAQVGTKETTVGAWRPLPDTKFEKDPELTSAQEKQCEELRSYIDKELALPESDDYAEQEKKYLDTERCMARFLKASDWKMDEAKSRVKSTLEWRREYKPDTIPPDEIREETEGGKVIVSGFDLKGRPVMYLRPARENTDPSPTQIRHMIFQLERAVDLLPPHVSKLLLVIDYAGASSKSNPSMKTAKTIIDILQNHYAERLGKAVVVNCPFYLKGIFSAVTPFLDPETKGKLQMNPDMKKLIPEDQLDAEFGGNYHFKYDYAVYLPAICKFCGIADDGSRTEARPLMQQSQSQASHMLHEENGDEAGASSAAADEEDSGIGEEAGDEEPAAGNKDKAAGKRTGTELSSASDKSAKQKKKRPSFLLCFRGNGLDDDDPTVIKAKAKQGIDPSAKSKDVVASATPKERKELAAAHQEAKEEQAAETKTTSSIPAEQTGSSETLTKEHIEPPATITESITQAVTQEVTVLSEAATQFAGSMWPATSTSGEAEAPTAKDNEAPASSGYLPSMPALPNLGLPSLWPASSAETKEAPKAAA